MLNKNIATYIQDKLAVGYSIDSIRNALFRWGYNIEDIDQTIRSLYSLKKEENTLKEKPKQFNLFFSPRLFFSNPINYTLKKALKYFLYSFLVFFSSQLIIFFLKEFISRRDLISSFASLLASISVSFIFLVFLLCFSFSSLLLVFLLLRYVLKNTVNLSSLSAIFLFCLAPYILINSINNTPIYNIVTLSNLSIGFFNLNVFFLWSLFLFSVGVSQSLGISFKKSAFFVFIPFLLVTGIMILAFFSIVKVNFL